MKIRIVGGCYFYADKIGLKLAVREDSQLLLVSSAFTSTYTG